ncbi:MAG: GGDEF domain-containing protein [Actinobacteria bacterium]|nr:GGDEF domain-containing protein [Actinomycetota bacterium]
MQEPRSAPLATGQGYLRSRLKTVHELELRRRTALRDWTAAVVAVGSQQFTPLGVKLSAVWFVILLGIALTVIAICVFVYPRLRAPRFMRVEQAMMFVVWGTTATIVYASGGADSPYIFFYAQSMIYSAYFFARSRLSWLHIAIGSVAAALPIAYDHQAAMASDFVPTIIVALAVWWAICAAIAFRRRVVLRTEHQARRLAMADPLTHVANVRAMNEFAEQLQSRSESDHQWSIALVDLDGLKTANSTHGHAGGDELIRRLAYALRVASREQDQVARAGGDEFVVVMPDVDEEQLSDWRRRFAAAIAVDNIANEQEGLKLAASVGTAGAPRDGRTLETLMNVADQRMYQQKTVTPAAADDRLVGEMLRAGKRFDATRATSKKRGSRLQRLDAPSGTVIAMLVAVGVAAAIHVTGGHESVLISLVLVAVAYFAYFGSRRQTIVGSAAMLAGFATVYFAFAPTTPVEQTRFTTIIFSAFVVGYALQVNGRKLAVAEHTARELSREDALSGVLNRRVFEEDLIDVLEWSSTGEALADRRQPILLVVDVDNFKTVNTLIGHPGGDKLIRAIAQKLKEAIGRKGGVYRVGGDEFAILLPHEPERDAEPYADRCTRVIRTIQSDGDYTRNGVNIGASVGFACWRPGVTGEMFFDQADKSMMDVKTATQKKRQGSDGDQELRALAC